MSDSIPSKTVAGTPIAPANHELRAEIERLTAELAKYKGIPRDWVHQELHDDVVAERDRGSALM